jgi:hypothetical protein
MYIYAPNHVTWFCLFLMTLFKHHLRQNHYLIIHFLSKGINYLISQFFSKGLKFFNRFCSIKFCYVQFLLLKSIKQSIKESTCDLSNIIWFSFTNIVIHYGIIHSATCTTSWWHWVIIHYTLDVTHLNICCIICF